MPATNAGYQLGKDLAGVGILLPEEIGLRAHVGRVAALSVVAAAAAGRNPGELRAVELAALMHHAPVEMLENSAFLRLARDLGVQPLLTDTDACDGLSSEVKRILLALLGEPPTTEDALAAALIESANVFDEQFENLPYEEETTEAALGNLAQSGMLHPLFVDMLKQLRATNSGALAVAAKRLPVFPKVALEAVRLAANPEADIRQLASIVGRDAVLATEVLKVANSGLYGRSMQSSTLVHALGRLGLDGTRKAIAAAALRPRFASAKLQTLWQHSLDVASAAEKMAIECGLKDPGESYLTGLVHDIGSLAFETVEGGAALERQRWIECGFPSSYAEFLISGTTHAEAGAAMLSAWHFPAHLVEAVEHHHRPENSESPLTSILYLCDAADEALPSLAREHRATRILGPGSLEAQDHNTRFQAI